MDEVLLAERLTRGVTDGPRPDLGALRARNGRRRRRRRALAGGASAVVVLLALVGAGLAAGSDPEAPDRVITTEPTISSTVPALVPDRPSTFTIDAVPASMSAPGCQLLEPRQGLRACSFDLPRSLVGTVNLSFVPGSATAEVRAGWDAGDGAQVAQLLDWGFDGTATFTELGGVRAIAFGESERIDGSSLGLPDRVALGWAVIVGDTVVQINSEAPEADLAELVAGLAVEPRWAALDGVLDELPEGAEVVAQGVRSRWSEPDRLRPELAEPPPATSYGADIVLPDAGRRGISVEVVHGLDVAAFLAGLRTSTGSTFPVTELDGRRAVRIDGGGPTDLVAGPDASTSVIPRSGTQLLVQVDDDTMLWVGASSFRAADAVEPVARRVLANLG